MTEHRDWPLVTVVILCFDRKDELRITLDKIIHELDYPADRLEIIICDNASTDGTSEMLRSEYPSLRHIRMPENVGITAWNKGIEEGRGYWFLLLDDDGHIEGRTLKEAICFLDSKKDVGILSFNVLDPVTRYSYTFNFPYGIFSFWGCAVLLGKKLVESIGGFDPNIFLYSHEPEYVIRAAKAGFRHEVGTGLIAFHRKDPRKQGEFSGFKEFHENFSRHYTYLKHLHSSLYYRYLLKASLWCLRKTILIRSRRKRLDLSLILSLVSAVRMGRKAKSGKNGNLERFIFENDPRCAAVEAGIISVSSPPALSFYRQFFSSRRELFPDYDEKYFLDWVPYDQHLAIPEKMEYK